VERRFPKERILEFYMNSVYFGAGAYGVKTASEEFFNKPMAELTISEAATLAVMVRNPSLYNPRSRPELTLERRDEVIREMQENGWIAQAQADAAVQDPIGVIEAPLRRGLADHVVAEVKRQLLNSPDFDFLGATPEERKKAVFGCPADDVACEGGGGLQVFTTIDLELQNKANEILQTWLPLPPYEENVAHCREILPEETDDFLARYAETHSCVPTGAMTMVDNWTGAVKVMASGLPFEFSQFDLAVQGRRNPGSSFKPFGLVAALENGFTMGHSWSGKSPIKIECPFPCAPNGSNIWTVHNAGSSVGVIDLETATYNSVNAVYAQLSLEVGPEKIVDVAKRMGVDESALDPVLSIVLGSSAVSTKEMANAFSNFATYGQHADDYVVAKIVNSAGETIYEHQPEVTQVADPAIFAAANRALKKVPVSGTAPRANIGIPQGGKTGTHQSYLDAWYVGYTPEYSTAVWIGYEAQQVPLVNVTINGQHYDRVFGGSVPAPIWAEFMSYVHQNLPVTDFPPEPGNIGKWLVPPPTTVPNVVGLDQGSAEAELREAKLNAAAEPVPSLEPAGTVVNQAPGGGATVRQGSFVTIYVSTGELPVAPLPNLQGMTFDQAVEAVRAFETETGVRVNLIQSEAPTSDPAQVGIILATEPPPGTVIEGAVDVVARIGILAAAPPSTEPPDTD
jgi:membrane peptidoglycan carboxypeptidase